MSIATESEIGNLLSGVSTARSLRAFELLQKDHYDLISHEYEAHYGDEYSLEYRRRFIYAMMFKGMNLSGMNILDAMCGSGETTAFLLENKAKVTGLDISAKVIDSFKEQWTDCDAVRRSLLDSGFPDNAFDCVTVVGGLHHIQPHVSEAVSEIYRILKPGGYFCFMEPHTGSIADIIRRFWYKHDRFFSDNESAIDMKGLMEEFAPHFSFGTVKYQGNIGFLLVLNSLIFRIPVAAKGLYSPLMLCLESLISKVQGKRTSCFVTAQWQKSLGDS